MSIYTIRRRWTARPIALVRAPSAAAAVALAAKQGVSLLYADLRGIELRGLRLRDADLRGVDCSDGDIRGADLARADARSARLAGCLLRCAVLRGADLRGADLRDSDLRLADLQGARLTGADLRGAVLQGARLAGATLEWRWSALPLELLRRHPAAGPEGSRAVAELAFAEDERPFAWLKTLLRQGLAPDPILAILADHVRPGDNAPALLRTLAADALPRVVTPPALWTSFRPEPRETRQRA